MVSTKQLSLAAAAALLSFSNKALAESTEGTTDFAVRAEGADGAVQDFVLRSVDEETLLARDVEELEERDDEELEERDEEELDERDFDDELE
ncbi:unnamed protein product, partial [Clonostachys rosea]